MIDLSDIRKNIILAQGLHYFDYTASGLAYAPIEKELKSLLPTYANTHSQSASSSILTHQHYEQARSSLKELLGLTDEFAILPAGYGSTAAIKKFMEILGIYVPPPFKSRFGIQKPLNVPLVIIGPFEHHSNELGFRQGFCDVVRIAQDEKGGVDYAHLERVLQDARGRDIIASFNFASNVTGIISDSSKISKLVRKYGGIMAFDAACSSPYMNIPSQHFDALFLSPHKLLGGVGSCGILAIKKELINTDEPSFAGGGTVSYVSRTSQSYLSEPEQLEQAGTPPILSLIKAYKAYKLRNDIGLDTIRRNETELKEYFSARLSRIKDIIDYSPKNQRRLAIFSFNIKGVSPYVLAEYLSENFGIQSRAGCACAGPYGHELLGLRDNAPLEQKPGWLRVGLHYTHTKDDVDYLIDCLKQAAAQLKKS